MSDDDLTRFIRDRYDEAEALAKAAEADWDAEYAMYEWNDLPDAAFAYSRNLSPACRLTDIALKRAILAEHQHEAASTPDHRKGPDSFGCATCDHVADEGTYGGGWCATVRQLGTEFSGHAGYKAGWAP